MKIILDAMGGDLAPAAAVAGAVSAAREYGVEVLLVGRGEEILAALKDQGIGELPAGISIANADDVVDMHDEPSTVLRTRKDSSMVVGLKMLAAGEGDAFISAGNTGALLTAATLTAKRIRGVRRATLAPVLPSKNGGIILTDAGANNECTPEFLLQFGYMGAIYAERIMGRQNPRVGLLSNGAEDSKGTPLVKQAHELLKAAGEAGHINFVGNVEARDVMEGICDVLVCDGFSGNVLLKGVEGTAAYMASLMKQMFMKNAVSKLGAVCCRSGLKELKTVMDYRTTGGTIFLGLTRPVIKAHGASDALAFHNAVRAAVRAVESGVVAEIEQNVDNMTVAKEKAEC